MNSHYPNTLANNHKLIRPQGLQHPRPRNSISTNALTSGLQTPQRYDYDNVNNTSHLQSSAWKTPSLYVPPVHPSPSLNQQIVIANKTHNTGPVTMQGESKKKASAVGSKARQMAQTKKDDREVRRRKFKPGTVALREIKHYQKKVNLLLLKLPF